jgi:hypothetical protein
MTIFGAVGRSEGRQGAASLIGSDRSGWLASNDVMRLSPKEGVRPGALWLAVSSQQVRLQINALSFGSVIDHMNPWDVEDVILPRIGEDMAIEAESVWDQFEKGASLMGSAANKIEKQLTV